MDHGQSTAYRIDLTAQHDYALLEASALGEDFPSTIRTLLQSQLVTTLTVPSLSHEIQT